MSLFKPTPDTGLQRRVHYFSVEELMAKRFNNLVSYDASYDVERALRALAAKDADPFPVIFLGQGLFACVFLTSRGTVWRVPVTMRDLCSKYLRDCARTTAPRSWMPKVHRVEECASNLWVAEVERLYFPEQSATDPRFKKLYKAWEMQAEEHLPHREDVAVARLLDAIDTYVRSNPSVPEALNLVMLLAFVPDKNDLARLVEEEILCQGPFVRDLMWLLKKTMSLETLYERHNIKFDVHGKNVMARPHTSELVLIDPFYA